MTTDLALAPPSSLLADMEYARVVAVGDLLPQAYRGKPANVLVAMGLGQAMGLSPAESLYRIHVIQGRPTASAELIAANVRKAGHRLRVAGDESSAWATIVRSDDPDFEFRADWTLDRARGLDLLGRDGWKKQPGTMLRWRAITEVARMACPEALYGVAYVADEVEAPSDAERPRRHTTTGPDALRQALAPEPPADDVHDAEEVPETEPITAAQLKALQAGLKRAGYVERDDALAYYAEVIGHPVESSKALTKAEASAVIDRLMSDTDTDDARDLFEVGQ